MENFARKFYAPVGQCVYCGGSEDLRNEHIIPVGLGGVTTLPKSTCERCAKITGQVEMRVLRGSIWPVRAFLKLRSRRPNEAPKTELITLVRRTSEEKRELPLEDSPLLLPMPVFEPPAYLTGRKYSQGINLIGVDTISYGRQPDEVAEAFGASIQITKEDRPAEFAKMVAKIGYTYAIAELGLDKIEVAGVVQAILGESTDIGLWVGTLEGRAQPQKGLLHRLELQERRTERLLIAGVQLFADSYDRVYGVVIGYVGT